MTEKSKNSCIIERNMKTLNITHKEMTDEEAYQNVKQWHKDYPAITMTPEEWKWEHLKDLKREGRVWSK